MEVFKNAPKKMFVLLGGLALTTLVAPVFVHAEEAASPIRTACKKHCPNTKTDQETHECVEKAAKKSSNKGIKDTKC